MVLHQTKKPFPSKGNYQQNEKDTYWMGKDIWSDISNQHGVNMQNIQRAHTTQYQKTGREPEQAFLQRRHTEDQQANENVFKITNHQRNTNQTPHLNDTSPQSWEWLLTKRQQITSTGKNVEKREPLCTAGGNVNWCSHYGETVGRFLKKLKSRTIWSSNSTPGYLSEENKILIWKDISTPMFTAVLSTIAKILKQPKCSSIDERIKKMLCVCVHTHTQVYYSAIKKRKTLPCATTIWKDLSEINQRQIPYYFIYVCYLKNRTNEHKKEWQMKKTNKWLLAGGWEKQVRKINRYIVIKTESVAGMKYIACWI